MNPLWKRTTCGLAFTVIAASAALTMAAEPTVSVRTYDGTAYRLANATLEVAYTIGEPKEKDSKEEKGKFGPAIQISTSASAGGEAAKPGQEQAEPAMLRATRELVELPVWLAGTRLSVPLEQIRSVSFSRKPTDLTLPSYVAQYRNAATLTLLSGEQLVADYVNLGTAAFKGGTPAGNIRIPWADVAEVVFER